LAQGSFTRAAILQCGPFEEQFAADIEARKDDDGKLGVQNDLGSGCELHLMHRW